MMMGVRLSWIGLGLLGLSLVKTISSIQSWHIDVTNLEVGFGDKKGVLQLTRLPFNERQEASCYEYSLFSKYNESEVLSTRQFCYPSIMITGHFKCSTSAMFALISKATNVNTTIQKEECISGNLVDYFNRLPGPDYGSGHLLSGCISLPENAWAAMVLRRPRTHYIVSDAFLLMDLNVLIHIVLRC